MYYCSFSTPLGVVCLAGTARGLQRLDFQHGARPVAVAPAWQEDQEGILQEARTQLLEYFQGQRRHFTVRLAPGGTPFQQCVWQALQQIPFGTTLTYQELAQRLGNPAAARAVGHANGKNPLAIVIPCHRLIGRDGRLRGYASGISFKARLLEHERRYGHG